MQSERKNKTNVAVIGLGGIGLGFAAALDQGGRARVIGCARREPASLTIEHDGAIAHINATVITSSANLEPVDWIVVATKVPQTESIVPWLDGLCDERTRIVVAQNGIYRDSAIAALAPSARGVFSSVIYFNGESDRPGHVRFRHAREVDVLLPDNDDTKEFAELLGPLVVTKCDPAFEDTAWRKLLLNVAANSLTALTMQRTAVLRDPDVSALALQLMEEAATVARAEGIALDRSAPKDMLEILHAYPSEVATSMYLDRLAGRVTEVEAFNGAVVELGHRHGLDCPMNAAALALMRAIDRRANREGRK